MACYSPVAKTAPRKGEDAGSCPAGKKRPNIFSVVSACVKTASHPSNINHCARALLPTSFTSILHAGGARQVANRSLS